MLGKTGRGSNSTAKLLESSTKLPKDLSSIRVTPKPEYAKGGICDFLVGNQKQDPFCGSSSSQSLGDFSDKVLVSVITSSDCIISAIKHAKGSKASWAHHQYTDPGL